jgi:hypothetical protein
MFDTSVEMISWVLDVSYKLGFVVIIAKFGNGGTTKNHLLHWDAKEGLFYYHNKKNIDPYRFS